MKIFCDICGTRFRWLGALFFSHPSKRGKTRKYHICIRCEETKIIPLLRYAEWNQTK